MLRRFGFYACLVVISLLVFGGGQTALWADIIYGGSLPGGVVYEQSSPDSCPPTDLPPLTFSEEAGESDQFLTRRSDQPPPDKLSGWAAWVQYVKAEIKRLWPSRRPSPPPAPTSLLSPTSSPSPSYYRQSFLPHFLTLSPALAASQQVARIRSNEGEARGTMEVETDDDTGDICIINIKIGDKRFRLSPDQLKPPGVSGKKRGITFTLVGDINPAVGGALTVRSNKRPRELTATLEKREGRWTLIDQAGKPNVDIFIEIGGAPFSVRVEAIRTL